MEGMPILLLTMIGAKTGRTLTRPLCIDATAIAWSSSALMEGLHVIRPGTTIWSLIRW